MIMNNIMQIKTKVTEKEGCLSFFESERDISFKVKRIYYIYDVPNGVIRGGHAHKRLWQLLYCPYGCIEIILDNGEDKKHIVLENPNIGLVVGPGVWREMLWIKENSVLCVAASEYYDENDYIRKYDEFISYMNNN